MNASIKNFKSSAEVVAEVYNPAQYRNYIHLGKMDYLYDKVELYDSLKHIIQGHGSTEAFLLFSNVLLILSISARRC